MNNKKSLFQVLLPTAAACVAAFIADGCTTHSHCHHADDAACSKGSCAGSGDSKMAYCPAGEATVFGALHNGTPIKAYTLRNKNGIEARFINYGGILQSLKVPDKNGKFDDVILGYDNVESYETNSPYFGAIIGRFGNRIAKGHFSLNGENYTLAPCNPPNSLHGGVKGFDKVVWDAKPGKSDMGQTLQFNYVSHDGEEGFPGTMSVTALMTLTDDDNLIVDLTATTDKDTIANLTYHPYFNLAGQGNGDILNHIVQINADKITPVDATQIPTGELRDVTGTPFDFRTPTAISAHISQADEQLTFGKGYDHNWVINRSGNELSLDGRATEPNTGRIVEVWSNQPGLQFYSGNFLDGTYIGKGGHAYSLRTGFCMEPQHFPDSPNHPNFPSTVLKTGDTYHNTIVYKFSAK